VSDGGLIKEMFDDGPLCPMSMGALNGEHRAERIFDDVLYEASKPFRVNSDGQPDPDGDLPKDLDTLYNAVVYSPTYRRMLLHYEATSFMQDGALKHVRAYYWRCHLCGYILPATTLEKITR
jgi:hypothetical protein